MTVAILPASDSVHGESNANTVQYYFANSNAGNADGTIQFTSNKPGTYTFYWGDEKGNKLQYNGIGFSKLGQVSTTSQNLTAEYSVVSSYTVIPEGARELLVYNSGAEKVASYDIPQEKQFHEEEALYQFGLMSDVHFNRYADYSSDDSVPAFNRALKFMNDRGIDFVGLTGDLSNAAETSAYTKFNNAINQYPNMTVYTCMGNHDVYWSGDAGKNIANFAKLVNTKNKTDSHVKNINSDTGVDFVYEKNGDIFIFFSQTSAVYRKNAYLVTMDQLNWLETNLAAYADKNVYLFFHTYFASENGDVTKAVGNLKNPGGYTYDLTYYFGNKDEARFRALLNKYPNVTMFSGHSHWSYGQQKYNPNLNIGNINTKQTGATLIHVSSVGAPRTIEENAKNRDENNGVKSEGMVAVKYKNATVYLAVDFVNNEYMADASYLNRDGKKGVSEQITFQQETTKSQKDTKLGKSKITSVGKAKKTKAKYYKVKIKYKKIANAQKYQIKYSTTKKFKAKKTKTRYSKKISYTIKKLKKNRKYYIKVRAFRKNSGKRIYGKWSKVKTLRIKR